MIRNKRGEVVFWFKGKDQDGGVSFGLCVFRPELADDLRIEKNLRHAFRQMLAWARSQRFPIFDAEDLDVEVKKFLKEFDAAELRKQRREEEVTLRVREFCTGRRLPLTVAMKPPEAVEVS